MLLIYKTLIVKSLILILINLSTISSYAQSEITIYFDKDWNKTSATKYAEYFRIIKIDENGEIDGKIRGYYITGELQWEGRFSGNFDCPNAEICLLQGICTWYYQNGQKSSEGYYSNGKLIGSEKYWDENGNLLDIKKETRQLTSSELVIKSFINSNIKNNTYDPLQGIWSVVKDLQSYLHKNPFSNDLSYSKKGIVKQNNEYSVFTIDEGRSSLKFLPTNEKNKFRVTYKMDSYLHLGGAELYSNSYLKVVIKLNKEYIRSYINRNNKVSRQVSADDLDIFIEMKFTKIYPSKTDIIELINEIIENTPSEGSGFAIGDNYIVTNYHVIESSNTIRIRGINGDFHNYVKATVAKQDIQNDIAILKVEGNVSIDPIPFSINSSTYDVGEDIFVLGYPLTATMGEEIKLTTGVISSQTGFQGSISNYQISAPIQPGNSGGPLFDKSGNIIGIVSAKHLETENVGYAIKISYLENLLDLLPLNVNKVNNLINMPLTEQVKSVKKFIYIIEVNHY